MTGLLYLLFFCSGLSGLIYQVIWVRVFGNVFGNTVYSASLVIAVFMLGLGVGSWVVGIWVDRREQSRPGSILWVYGAFELLIALLALAVSIVLPHLGQLSASISAYTRGADGWYVLSTLSYVARGAIAVLLLAPITFLMGGTLTLLIRHLVRRDFVLGDRRIAALYAANTAGAALGCFLTDFAFVPAFGIRGTQMTAIGFNLIAAVGAAWLARLPPRPAPAARRRPKNSAPVAPALERGNEAVFLTAIALGLSGFAAMGIEILWFRHVSILLGEFRAVFSLLLTIVLVGIGAGSVTAGSLLRRATQPLHGATAARWLILVQTCFVVSTLIGLGLANEASITHAIVARIAGHGVSGPGALEQLWFNARPILLEVGIPAVLMGAAFPLANAVVQNTEQAVGRRAGVLYLANTAGAVCGSLTAGFLLVPTVGIQNSTTVLMIVATLAIVPLRLATTSAESDGQRGVLILAPLLAASAAVALWLLLPANYVIMRAQLLHSGTDRLLTLSEGVTETVAVVEDRGHGRTLLTNGHPMSSTEALSQRYMRALVHIPLLSVENPERVLVMCFGVGNTAHAATLYPSIRRIDVVDLSRHVLEHSSYFKDTNGDVLHDPRVAVYVNDGRQHLQMQRDRQYDLITLEPPPIAQAGTGALYSREFYALARTRLTLGGFMSQWLPVAQVPAETTLAMVRAFVEVFPQTVLISGARMNLLLLGANDSRVTIDPATASRVLASAPAARADLQRLELGGLREIVGTFVASAETLASATKDSAPVTDDRPMQEYGVQSLLGFGEVPPSSLVDVRQVASWCPKCFASGRSLVDGLDTYLDLLELVYKGSPAEIPGARTPADRGRVVAGSAYLGAILPESAAVHMRLATALAARDRAEEAIAEFRQAVRLEPDNGEAHYLLATILLEVGQYDAAGEEFRAALREMPHSVKALNNLGVTLASQGKLDEAIDQFQHALALEPGFADARRNMAGAVEEREKKINRR